MLSTGDVAELENMVPAMEAAWRTGDAASYAAQFTVDAEHVNAYGMWWHGRDEIFDGIGFALSQIYPTNQITTSEFAVEALSPDIAVVRYRWRLQPYSDPDGTHYADPQGRIINVLVKRSDGWRIRFFQSTFINPAVPHAR